MGRIAAELVEDHRIAALGLVEAAADPGGGHRLARAGVRGCGRGRRGARDCRHDLRAARLDPGDPACGFERSAERLEAKRRLPAAIATVAGKVRIGKVEKSGSGPIWITGQPSGSWWRWGSQGTIASSTRTASASGEPGPDVEARVERMVGREREPGRPELDDRDREALGEAGERGKAALGAVAAAADDQGPPGAGQDAPRLRRSPRAPGPGDAAGRRRGLGEGEKSERGAASASRGKLR